MYKEKWYLSPWIIAFLFALSSLTIPAIIGLILLIIKSINYRKAKKKWQENNYDELISTHNKFESIKLEFDKKQEELTDFSKKIEFHTEELLSKQNELNLLDIKIKENHEILEKINNHEQIALELGKQTTEYKEKLKSLENKIQENKVLEITANESIALLNDEREQLIKKVTKEKKLISNLKAEYQGITQLIENFPQSIDFSIIEEQLNQSADSNTDSFLSTIVELELHHKDSKLLRKEMSANNRDIKKLLNNYKDRYSTKANQTIYELMVIGLQAELQNILYTLSYSNLDKGLEKSKELIHKYLTICGNGNASILPTITRFLSELEPFFSNAIQIEYKYYFQKEKEKEEQRKIKEQMRQEAEERRILLAEQKKLEKEEEKYLIEIAKNKDLLEKEKDDDKILALKERLRELELQVNQLEEEKDEIIKRANGKAGYVYVISNLGSFGDNTFKVGMTRRLNPLERIDELGSASVPFKFDIHAMMFSDNAVDLEQQLHQILDDNRVNKINYRKEFFNVDVSTLQDIVQNIDPTVEFTTTMKAFEYRQSQNYQKNSSHNFNSPAYLEVAATQ